jgi:hypothetical protein
MTLIGKVYKLSNPKSEKVYIGSSYCKYLTIRLAHHRQNHRNKWKEYYGLFDDGDPDMEVLDTIELQGRDEAWKLRELEQKYVNEHDNCMNIRKCYLTQEEKNIQRELAVSRYQNSPSGKLSMRKSYLNQRLKNIKNKTTIKTIHPSVVKQIENEIKFISEQQKLIRETSSPAPTL